MSSQHLPATTSTIRAQGWAHPRPDLSIDDLVSIMERIGNTVLEVHRSCNCIGAGDGANDHLLVLDKEVVQ